MNEEEPSRVIKLGKTYIYPNELPLVEALLSEKQDEPSDNKEDNLCYPLQLDE